MKFPHISRFFSAIVRWSLLLAIFTMSLLGIQRMISPLRQTQLQTLVDVWNPTVHEELARVYWAAGYLPEAIRELRVANSLPASAEPGVLGETSATNDLEATWESEPARLEKSYAYWQSVIAAKPDYRDAYLALASLAYQLGHRIRAQTYLQKAVVLDPFSQTVENLTWALGKQQ